MTEPSKPRGPYRRGNAARQAILAAAREHPGLSRSEILRRTGLSWGAVAHHVAAMVARGELQAATLGKRPFYHAAEPDAGLLPLRRLLRAEPAAQSVLRLLNQGGAYSVQELSRVLGVGRKTVRRHVAALVEAGLAKDAPTLRAKIELRQVPLALREALAEA